MLFFHIFFLLQTTIRPKIINTFKKNSIIKEIVDYCCNEAIVNKGSLILSRQQVVYKHHQNFSLTLLINQMSFENEFFTHAYFYETLCLKINWNLDRALLNISSTN